MSRQEEAENQHADERRYRSRERARIRAANAPPTLVSVADLREQIEALPVRKVGTAWIDRDAVLALLDVRDKTDDP